MLNLLALMGNPYRPDEFPRHDSLLALRRNSRT